MPWLIVHKCSDQDAEPVPYGMVRGHNERQEPLTRAVCQAPGGCGERLVFLGHDVFDEAHTAVEVQGSHMPKGFVVARTALD